MALVGLARSLDHVNFLLRIIYLQRFYASPKVTKYQVYHSFMSSYIFIHQLFYIRVILSCMHIYVKTISSVSV